MATDRVRMLGLVFFVPLVLIGARVIHLQFGLGPWHRVAMAESEVATRLIRAPRGTIYTSSGRVLATDRCDADLAVHYRYLERPIDSAWLERTARARLTRKERRDPDTVRQAIEQLHSEVAESWQALADLTGVPADELDRRAAVIQRRVERIAESVNRRRSERWHERMQSELPRGRPTESTRDPTDSNSLLHAEWSGFQRFCDWLADEPARPVSQLPPEPISVAEQDQFFTLIKNISPAVLVAFTSNPERFPGIRLEQRIRRVYPEQDVACSVIGYVEPGGDSADNGSPINSGHGVTGIEGYYDELLAGVPGHVRERTMLRGGMPQALGGRPPHPGQDITLTLDMRLQQWAEQSLDEIVGRETARGHDRGRVSSGAIVLLDVRTGALLAAASSPRFDLNLASDPTSDAARELARRPDSPLFNRIVQMTLAPGSTFKPVSAIAGLKCGIDPSETLFCRGYLHRPDSHRCLIYRNFGVGHEAVTMHEALVRSCNVYFFQLAERVGGENPKVRFAGSAAWYRN
jgi:penicillin-binding protein 2